ncbi:hypothetical protein [Pedobacter sp. GR22-6]|uniref:hypothetical protein n=1 Tax=Pedobacter sp. GR22-6 TaxID=3127957 RepID=UPI00307EAACB
MKATHYVLAAALAMMASCASPEERSTDQADTTENQSMKDSTSTDTVTNTGSTSGSNGTGTDTTDTKRQKATRQAGND